MYVHPMVITLHIMHVYECMYRYTQYTCIDCISVPKTSRLALRAREHRRHEVCKTWPKSGPKTFKRRNPSPNNSFLKLGTQKMLG